MNTYIFTRNLKKGLEGEDVKQLQLLLNSKNFNCGTADGIFGSKTSVAVKDAQDYYGLTVDGVAGKNTIQSLGGNWKTISSTPSTPNVSSAPSTVIYTFSSNLRKGDKGTDVKNLQLLLNQHGYSLTTDGDFGTKTYNAVKSFQESKGLTADGIAGKNTIEALGAKWVKQTSTSTSTVVSGSKPSGKLVVCSFNIKRGTYRYGTQKIIADIIKDADIVGIQEVTPTGANNISNYSGKTDYMCETISNYGHAVFTNYGVNKRDTTTLTGTGERRKLYHMVIGDVSYYNTHFHYSNPTNDKQLAQLVDILSKDKSRVIIVTGDFNRQSYDSLVKLGFNQTNKGQAITNTEGGSSIVNKIDQIFVKGANVTRLWKYEAVNKKYSDHDALFAEIVY